jgi:DNA-binding XRE family transcriptional regulator
MKKQIKKYVDWLNTNTLTQEELAKSKGVTSRTIRNETTRKKIKVYKLKAIRLYENIK